MMLDLLLILLVGGTLWLGYRKSAFRFVIPLLEWIGGLWLLMQVTPPILSFLHRTLNPEPRMAFLFTLIVLMVIIFYLMVRLNRALMSRMRGKAAGVAVNAAKALIAALLVIVVAGWLVQALDRQGWLPEATRQASYTYPVLKTTNSVTGSLSQAFAETFHRYTLLVKNTFTL